MYYQIQEKGGYYPPIHNGLAMLAPTYYFAPTNGLCKHSPLQDYYNPL